MKKQLWILRKLFRSIRGRSILLWIQIFILSLALNYCLIHPLSTITGYDAYDKSGLENAGLYTVGFQYVEWSTQEKSPAYRQLVDELSQIAEIGVIESGFAQMSEYPDDVMSLIVYPRSFIDRVDLPIPADPEALRNASRSDALPLVLDHRLCNTFSIGQETQINVNNVQYPAYVVGFMGKSNEFFGVPYASSYPTLDNLLRSGDSNYTVLTVHSDLLPIETNKAQSAIYMFAPLGERITDYLPGWQNQVESRWLGSVHSLEEMKAEQFMTELVGSAFELYLVCVWCIALFLVGLQGFFTNIMTRLHRQLAVYRMLGITRVQWVCMVMTLVFIPVLTCGMLGWSLANSFGFEHINRVAPTLGFGTAVFTLVSMLPALIIEMRAWRSNATELYKKEARA